MDTEWFYLEHGNRRGPVDLSALIHVLLAAPEPRRLKIWREGLADWQDAGAVAEVSTKLPPPVPAIAANEPQTGGALLSQADTVVQLYRRLIALFAAQYLLAPILLAIAGLFTQDDSEVAAGIILLVFAFMIGTFAWVVVTAYSLMRAVETRSVLLRAVGMFVPLVNLFVLLGISRRTNRWCKEHNIKVGFLGPSRSALTRNELWQ